jgi:hypothetical protein
MDSGIHAFLIAQHVQTRIAEAQTERSARIAGRRSARKPQLRMRLTRRRRVVIPQA